VTELDSTTGIVALAAAAVAVVAMIGVLVLAVRLRRVRLAQTTVLGDSDRDVVRHAADLERKLAEDARRLERASAGLDERISAVETRLQTVVSRTAVIRYDAYNEMTGRQSSSIAMLDDAGTGIVLSSILHREQARFYAKWVIEGRSELDLSPEEREAITEAMSTSPGRHSAAEPARTPPGGSAP
jgi:Protein of unknown function (DUF4446)